MPAAANRFVQLLARKTAYETAIDELVSGVASVTISGGVSYTRADIDKVRGALDGVNAELSALASNRPGGMVRTTPRYL
jgi:hypothetical protein